MPAALSLAPPDERAAYDARYGAGAYERDIEACGGCGEMRMNCCCEPECWTPTARDYGIEG